MSSQAAIRAGNDIHADDSDSFAEQEIAEIAECGRIPEITDMLSPRPLFAPSPKMDKNRGLFEDTIIMQPTKNMTTRDNFSSVVTIPIQKPKNGPLHPAKGKCTLMNFKHTL